MKRGPRTGIAVLLVATSVGSAQDVSRSRIEREASAQAAQADKLFKAGRFEAALKLYRAEADSRKTIGDARYEAYAHRGVGCCLVGLKDDASAIDEFRAAMAIDASRDDPGFAGYDGLLIAQAQLRLGRAGDAVETLAKALPRLGQAVDRDHECDARVCLTHARVALGEPGKAVPDAARAWRWHASLTTPPGWRTPGSLWVWSIATSTGSARRSCGCRTPATPTASRARYRPRPGDGPARRRPAPPGPGGPPPRRCSRRPRPCTRSWAIVRPRPTIDSTSPPSGSIWAMPPPPRARPGSPATASSRPTTRPRRSRRWSSWPRPQFAREGQGRPGDLGRDDPRRPRPLHAAHRDAPACAIRLLLLSADLEGRLGRKADASSCLAEAAGLADAAGDASLRTAVAAARARLAEKPAGPR